MRYATYNIEAGGFLGYHDLDSKWPARLPELQAAVAQVDADVIALPDSFRWSEFAPADIAHMFNGYEHNVTVPLADRSLKGNGDRIAITVLSKREFMFQRAVPLNGRNAVHVRVAGDKGPVEVLASYLSHESEDDREIEAAVLGSYALSLSPKDELESVVCLGDKNTTADRTPRTFFAHQVAKMVASRSVDAAQLAEACRGDALRVLFDCGFVDTCKNRKPTFPTDRWARQRFGRTAGLIMPSLVRLDYILASPDMKIVSPATRHRGKVFDIASDHYPVSAELE